jgi:UbiD family decarboxylase
MRFDDLRQFMSFLEEHGQLARVKAPVSLEYELGAVCRKVLNARGPALLFENPIGTTVPVAANIIGTRQRYAMALGTTPERVADVWGERIRKNPIPPVIVKKGVCQENVLMGDKADLLKFSMPVWNELDGGPYITFPCHITKDNEGNRNVGMYRAQVFGPRELGIYAGPYRGLVRHRKTINGPFPVAIAIGNDPIVSICATASFPYGVDEMGMAGALRGAPVELVPCVSVPLEVPATAEIVIEGTITEGDERPEGRYSEFTGHATRIFVRPVIRVTAITHRNGAIHQGSYNGRPPHESLVMTSVPMESEIKRLAPMPGIKQINVTEEGCGDFICAVSCEKPYEGYARQLGLGILGTPAARVIKILILCDTDVDVFNPADVQWALATRVQPHRDVEILRELTGSLLDPSIDPADRESGWARTSKMMIDATRYKAHDFEPVVRPHPTVMAEVEKNWEKYGIRI